MELSATLHRHGKKQKLAGNITVSAMKQRLFPILMWGVVILACIAFYFLAAATHRTLPHTFFRFVFLLFYAIFSASTILEKISADYYIAACYGSTDTFQYPFYITNLFEDNGIIGCLALLGILVYLYSIIINEYSLQAQWFSLFAY